MSLFDKKRKEEGKIPDYSTWFRGYTNGKMDIQKVMDKQDNEFNYAYSLLFNDIPDFKYLFLNKRKKNNKNQSNFLQYISNDSEKILSKAYTKINFMRSETKNLDKFNSLGLQKTSKSFFQTNRPITSKSNTNSKKNKDENISTILEIPLNDNKKKEYTKRVPPINFNAIFDKNRNMSIKSQNNTEVNNLKTDINIEQSKKNLNLKKIPKKRKIFSAFNKIKKVNYFSTYRNKSSKNSPIDLFKDKREDTYRKLINIDIQRMYSNKKIKYYNILKLNEDCRLQMKKSLHQYKVESHLRELNKIQESNLSVRKSIETVKSKINQKIDDHRKGEFYKKGYLKYKKENEKEKRENPYKKRDFPNQIRNNIIFKSENKNKKVKIFPHGYKIRALYDFCKHRDRIEKKKKDYMLKYGDQILTEKLYNKDYELLNNSLDELFNALEVDSIIKYIDKFKNEKVCKNKNLLKERIKDYFPVLTETEKNIQKINKYQIEKLKKFEEEGWLNKTKEIKL